MSAYIVRAEHPYYVVTDSKGQFSLTDVPPGTYKLTMWHEGVKVVKTIVKIGNIHGYCDLPFFPKFANVHAELYLKQRSILKTLLGLLSRLQRALKEVSTPAS